MSETRVVKIINKYYKIPTLLNILFINGEPFAHCLEGDLTCCDNTMEDYTITYEEMPYLCPEYLQLYIMKNFVEVNNISF